MAVISVKWQEVEWTSVQYKIPTVYNKTAGHRYNIHPDKTKIICIPPKKKRKKDESKILKTQ